jgi:hypothetical protein
MADIVIFREFLPEHPDVNQLMKHDMFKFVWRHCVERRTVEADGERTSVGPGPRIVVPTIEMPPLVEVESRCWHVVKKM